MEIISNDGEAPNEIIPAELRQKMAASRRDQNVDLAQQIALLELGGSYYNDDFLCKTYGMNAQTLALFKRHHRDEIERYKERHKYGKFKVLQEIVGRVTLMEALRESAINGNDVQVKRLTDVFKLLEKHAPVEMLKDLAGLMKDADDTPAGAVPANAIQVNINNGVAAAEAALAARRNAAVEAKTDKA